MIRNEQERQRIGARIAELRNARGISQARLAVITGLQRSHIVRIEQGAYGVTIDVLAAIAEALGCSVDFVENKAIVYEP